MLVRLFYKTLVYVLKMNSENGLADRYLEKEELEKSFQSCFTFSILSKISIKFYICLS